jgi:hypothetical protein
MAKSAPIGNHRTSKWTFRGRYRNKQAPRLDRSGNATGIECGQWVCHGGKTKKRAWKGRTGGEARQREGESHGWAGLGFSLEANKPSSPPPHLPPSFSCPCLSVSFCVSLSLASAFFSPFLSFSVPVSLCVSACFFLLPFSGVFTGPLLTLAASKAILISLFYTPYTLKRYPLVTGY